MHTRQRSETARQGERGLSVLELTLMLGALMIITAALTPAVLRMVHQSRQNRVQEELETLHASMLGSDATGTFGYVGDLGRLPYSLPDLVQRADQPLFAISELSGVGYGWNGPYANQGRDASDYRNDPWGNAYDIGQVGLGQLRSAGPNGLYDDADDIVYPPNPVNIYGTVVVTVKGTSDSVVTANPEGCTVTLHYSDGVYASSVVDDTAPYSFSSVHRGLHTVEATCVRFDGAGNATESVVVPVRGLGAQQVVELFVEMGVVPSGTSETENRTASRAETSTEEGPQSGQR